VVFTGPLGPRLPAAVFTAGVWLTCGVHLPGERVGPGTWRRYELVLSSNTKKFGSNFKEILPKTFLLLKTYYSPVRQISTGFMVSSEAIRKHV
jgi:hypothetical protein